MTGERGDTLMILFMFTFQLKGDCKFYEEMALIFFFKGQFNKNNDILKICPQTKMLNVETCHVYPRKQNIQFTNLFQFPIWTVLTYGINCLIILALYFEI